MDIPVPLCIHRRANGLAWHNTFLGEIISDKDTRCDVCQAIGARNRLLQYRYANPEGVLLLDPGTGILNNRGNGLADTAHPGSSKDSRMKLPDPNKWPDPTYTLEAPPTPYTDENIDVANGWYDVNKNEFVEGRRICEQAHLNHQKVDKLSMVFNDATLIRDTGSPNMPQLSTLEFPIIKTAFFDWLKTQMNSKVSFPVICGENGETYHGLFAALLANSIFESQKVKFLNYHVKFFLTNESYEAYNSDTKAWETRTKESSSSAQRQLLRYYLSADQAANVTYVRGNAMRLDVPSKRRATKLICMFFNKIPQEQTIYFQALRDFIDDKLFATAVKNPLVSPSGQAMYWINNLIKATGQQEMAFGPKAGRVAFIFVRSTQTAPDRRIMDWSNVQACITGIRMANFLCDQATGQATVKFTDVVIFGDIPLTRINNIQQNPEVFQKDLKYTVIPGPFYTDTSGHTDITKVRRIWKMFKENVNYAPAEVMMLGIYNALQDRFRESLVCLGWRSGSLDGAGFLGIPIFFFDDVIVNNDRKAHLQSLQRLPQQMSAEDRAYLAAQSASTDWKTKYMDGKYLFDPPAPGPEYDLERMEEAAFYIDTFVIIVVQRLWGALDAVENPDVPFELVPTRTPGNDGSLEDTTDVLKLGIQACRHLAVALFLWSCSVRVDYWPSWTSRIQTMSVSSQEVREQWLQHIKERFEQLDAGGYEDPALTRPNKRGNTGEPDHEGGNFVDDNSN